MKHPIIQQLRMERRAREISQLAIATEIGVGQHSLARHENGHHLPRLDTVSEWAAALGYELVLKKRGEP
jgi:predicted transcriptional regulator